MLFQIANTSFRVEENWADWEMQEVLDQVRHAAQEIEQMIRSKQEADKLLDGNVSGKKQGA